MLNVSRQRIDRAHRCPVARNRQKGVVLMIALIVLVALTIGGVALLRSVDTTNIIAGNLAFQQSATRSAEAGLEDAIRSVMEGLDQAALYNDDFTRGYIASTPAAGNPSSWDDYWRTTLNPNPVTMPVAAKTCVDRVCTLVTDAAGNTVSYVIQRLCQSAGPPHLDSTGCSSGTRRVPLAGENLDPSAPKFTQMTKYYYRVTARVVGPRNTTSYVQMIVAK